MLISVIIPVYNVEEYLHYAIESLEKQTYKNFEIILVNDGSTDNSGELCDEYSEKYSNVRVFHKENGGLSDARNFGVQKAKGEFITFLDPDDYLEVYSLELLASIQEMQDCDIVSTRVKATELYNVYSNRSLTEEDIKNVIVMNRDIFLEEAFYDKVATVSACGKLYRKSILEIPFPKGKIYEDLYIISEHVGKANKIVHTPIQIYNYYRRQGSIVNSKFTSKQYDFFDAINHNRTVIKNKYNDKKSLENAVNAKEVAGGLKICNTAYLTNLNDVNKINSILKKNKMSFLLNKRINIKFKIKYILFILSPKIFYGIKNILKKGVNNGVK
jgi:glycosyltransferase, group 2 family